MSILLFGKSRVAIGYAWAWGLGTSGELGDNSTTSKSSPVQVVGGLVFRDIAAAYTHGHAIKAAGTLWSWGAGTAGRLGDGTTVAKSSPIQVGALTDWSKVYGFELGGHAVKTDGTLWGWGNNSNGEIGDSSTVSKSSPVQIGALTDWDVLSVGAHTHVLAVKTDNTLWSWGFGASGQLGDGTAVTKSSPVQVGALTTWEKCFSGNAISAAIKTDGTLWMWGGGSVGSLGQGNTTDYSSPVQVGALTDWKHVAVGASGQVCATKTDGTLWSWGAGSSGELGDGTTVSRSSPVQVGALTDWDTVESMNAHVIALKTDGSVWAWGLGTSGQLGDGTAASKSSPVQVIGTATYTKAVAGGTHSYGLGS